MTLEQSNNSSGIEVDGIYFETLVSERKYNLPIFGEETPMKFGVRITNNSLTPYRFELPHFVPEILNPHGKVMEMSFARNATRTVEESDIPLIMSGESLEYWMDAKFKWYNKNCIELFGYGFYGGIWGFYNFKPTKYQIRMKYVIDSPTLKLPFSRCSTEYGNFWTGQLTTNFVNLRLR
jgi:hypothetical protein